MHRFLVADDHALLREGIETVLKADWPGSVVVHALDGPEALAHLVEGGFDLAVIDVGMPLLDGLEVVSRARCADVRTPILVLSMHPEERMGVRALRCGATGYVSKDSPPAALREAVTTLLSGRKAIPPDWPICSPKPCRPPARRSSPRRCQAVNSTCCAFFPAGAVSAKFPKRCRFPVKTVHTYRTRLLKKLGLERTGELVRLGVEEGLTQEVSHIPSPRKKAKSRKEAASTEQNIPHPSP